MPEDQLGGQASRVASNAAAISRRNAEFIIDVHARWREPTQDTEWITWARWAFDALAPLATGFVHVNFMPEDGVIIIEFAAPTGQTMTV
jgi:hypothetical protein